MKANYGKKKEKQELRKVQNDLMMQYFNKLIEDGTIQKDYSTKDTYVFTGDVERPVKTKGENNEQEN